MASKFSMMHENIEQNIQAQLDAEDKMSSAMNDLRVKAAAQERERRDIQRYQEQVQSERQERPEAPKAKARFAGDDAGYMVADHPVEDDHVDIHELHHGKNQELGRNNPGGDSDSDDEFDDLLDDPDILKIRNKRLNELRSEHEKKQEQLAKGHGTYNEILEENFLKEVCNASAMSAEDKFGYENSEDADKGKAGFVICHFFHKDFEKCKVIDMHLRRIAHMHLESKFIRIDAEKTPFFVEKLKIRVLPCIIVFNNGVACPEDQRIMGYEGLADDLPEEKKDEFPMSKLQERLADLGCIKYYPPTAEMEEEMKQRGGNIFGGCNFDTEFDDDE
jgi:hypothetical protein